MSDLKDFVIENGVLKKYTGSGGDVVIPEGVTIIGEKGLALNGVFNNRDDIISVILPNGVEHIGGGCFLYCKNLKSITIPKSLKTIGDFSFNGCTSLTSVIIPDNVTSIGAYAFCGCKGLTRIVLPKSVTSIGDAAFLACEGLADEHGWVIFRGVIHGYYGKASEIVIPDGITRIGSCVFSHFQLPSITIPENVTSIGANAFSDSRQLLSVTIAAAEVSIDSEAFKGCSFLRNVRFLGKIGGFGKDVFSGCHPELVLITPENALSTSGNLSTDICKLGIDPSAMDIAFIILYQKGKTWQTWIRGQIDTNEKVVFGHMLTQFAKDKKAPAAIMAGFIDTYIKALTTEQIKKAIDLLEQRKYKGLAELKKKPEIAAILAGESIEVNPIEAFVKECIERKGLQPGSREVVKGGIRYANSEMRCSIDAVAFIISEYIIIGKRLNSTSSYDGNTLDPKKGIGFFRSAEADRVADALDSEDLSKLLYGLINNSRLQYRIYMAAWGRFAQGADVMRETYDIYARNDPRMRSSYIKKVLLLNDSIEAMLFEYRIANIEAYAMLRGMTVPYFRSCFMRDAVPQLRDAMLDTLITHGVHYTGSEALCPREDIITLIKVYEDKRVADETISLIKQVRGVETIEDILADISMNENKDVVEDTLALIKAYSNEEADPIDIVRAKAEKWNRNELSDVLTELVDQSYYTLGCMAWARFANEESVRKAWEKHIHMSRGKAAPDELGKEFYLELMNSDTIAAMQMFDKYGDLDEYARMRGMTAMELRDSMMLPAFDFDVDGVKHYDIGGNTIEVSIAPDLSFRLFDVNKQKEIRSFPKKSDDPAKAEACTKEFAAFKKEVLAFAKQRTELLHKMHMSGEYVRADLWQKVYVEHPVISKLARLVVWQDETQKTFMIADDGIIDSQSSAYAPQGKIRIAHVLDMDAADIAAWQQWLAKRGCVQLFEQVWEPVIHWDKDGIATRYTGSILTNEERNAVKKALKLRGVDMRAEEMNREFNHRTGQWEFSNEGTMLFGDCLRVDYTVDENTKDITFGKASIRAKTGNREMNATLLEMDRATLSTQITRDNDAALTDQALSVFAAAQITGLLNLAIDRKATRCTARLLDYKNTHFPEFAEVNEFSLDW